MKMKCPNCEKTLIIENGIYKCESCEYKCEINMVDYALRSNRTCMICGSSLKEKDLKLCEECKNKILNGLEFLK